jgi:predicted RNA-binding protein with PUA-like domain
MKYWLMKSEPSTFSIDDLARAANMLRDEMAVGDLAFMYHSSCDEPGIVGVIEIVKPGYPDNTAFDRKHDHYDAASKPESPRWYMVDVRLKQRFSRVISLDELRRHESKQLREMLILKRGNRLSITPIDASHWKFIMSLQ